MSIIVALGSRSEVKEGATTIARQRISLYAKIVTVAAASGVNPQPYGLDEIAKGARNRARAAQAEHPGAWALGAESGLCQTSQGWIDIAAIVLIDPNGREWLIWSDALVLPTEDVEAVIARGPQTTIGEIIAERTGCKPYDPHLQLTGKSRTIYLADAIERILRFVGLGRPTEKETPMSQKTHFVRIGTVVRHLPVRPVNTEKGIHVAYFDIECDPDVTMEAGRLIAERILSSGKPYDVIVMPAGKATPMLTIVGHLTGLPIVVLQKKKRTVMRQPIVAHDYVSITSGPQTFYMDADVVERLAGMHAAIIDDVDSTGGSRNGVKGALTAVGATHDTVYVVFTEGGERDGVVSVVGDLPFPYPV